MNLKEGILAKVEVEIEKYIEEKCDAAVEAGMAKLAALIPGQIDDILLEKIKPEVKASIKAELLKQAEKISPNV